MRKARKGISPIIATVLLILIAIATGILIYAFANGWIGGRLSSGTGPTAVLTVENGYWNKSENAFVLYVRNNGGAPANITTAYITFPNGTVYYISKVNITSKFNSSGKGTGVVIDPTKVGRVIIYPPNAGVTNYINKNLEYVYKITLVSADGSEVTYSLRAS